MHKLAWCGAIAFGLIGCGPVLAQSAPEPGLSQSQRQSPPAQPEKPGVTRAPEHTVPPPPHAQPQAPIADQAKPAAVGPAQANTASSLPGDTPPGATGQTMPSTISKENAALDKLPIVALQLPLTEQQKKTIAKSVAAAPKTQASGDIANSHVATFLPINTPLQEFSADVTQQVPPLDRYKYVKLEDRVLIVDPPSLTVVGEIKP
jgi:hypothetical protein